MVSSFYWDSIAMPFHSENIPEVPCSGETEPPRAVTPHDDGPVSKSRPLAPRPWGPWASVGWTLLCLAVLVVAQIAVLIVFAVVRVAQSPAIKPDDLNAIGKDLATNGNLLSAATLASTPAVVGLVALLIRIRHYPLRKYLALTGQPHARSCWRSAVWPPSWLRAI